MIISYGKIIEEIIEPHGLDAYGLTQTCWASDTARAQATFTGDPVTLTDSKKYTGEFNSANTKIYPDPDNQRIRIDFELDNVQQMKPNDPPINPHGGPPPPNWDYSPQPAGPPLYRVKWSGYIAFSLDATGGLTSTYTQDDSSQFSIEKTEDETVWLRVVEDIFTLGFHELGLFLDGKQFHSDMSDAINSKGGGVVSNLIEAVELPGNSVFTFQAIDWMSEGLRVTLKYKD